MHVLNYLYQRMSCELWIWKIYMHKRNRVRIDYKYAVKICQLELPKKPNPLPMCHHNYLNDLPWFNAAGYGVNVVAEEVK